MHRPIKFIKAQAYCSQGSGSLESATDPQPKAKYASRALSGSTQKHAAQRAGFSHALHLSHNVLMQGNSPNLSAGGPPLFGENMQGTCTCTQERRAQQLKWVLPIVGWARGGGMLSTWSDEPVSMQAAAMKFTCREIPSAAVPARLPWHMQAQWACTLQCLQEAASASTLAHDRSCCFAAAGPCAVCHTTSMYSYHLASLPHGGSTPHCTLPSTPLAVDGRAFEAVPTQSCCPATCLFI